jgi:hypothetical protein
MEAPEATHHAKNFDAGTGKHHLKDVFKDETSSKEDRTSSLDNTPKECKRR